MHVNGTQNAKKRVHLNLNSPVPRLLFTVFYCELIGIKFPEVFVGYREL